ncbi:competence protein, ComEC family [Arcobacter acticola]|jgi:competence protein ComEC|uniref:Competence protein, ComEC family n=1 Tax=Arcobacter acticola TaxID=1849015 RepID=A0A6M8EVX2_9BACT|nr:ComEC/Rec2 family competence protein [Arcobacter acticola]QKE28647.1 competence protein, ComEC family [Arcobacter acticola]
MITFINKYRLFLLLFFIFLINISIEHKKYEELTYEEIFETKVSVLNIYDKKDYQVLKLKADNFIFYTSLDKEIKLDKLDILNIAFISKKVTFIDYLKGFYSKTIYFDKLERNRNFKDELIYKINLNHQNEMISELFQALFLAIPISSNLRDICTNYGISHLIALSGFHIAVISFVIYWLLYFPYSFFHKRYFPYRNRKFDLLVICILVLFSYLFFVGIVPSLLRSLIMLVLSVILLRNNIEIFSFGTLLYTVLLIITFIPSFIFSLGFWFSVIAVFYIILYMKYFYNMNKYLSFIFFNFWMFLIFNPIVHFYFPQTSYEQFLSPIITVFFTLFYPFEIFAHIFDFAIYFDDYLKIFLEYKMNVFEVFTPFYFFVIYLVFSLVSTINKKAFLFLNILMVVFSFYLYI